MEETDNMEQCENLDQKNSENEQFDPNQEFTATHGEFQELVVDMQRNILKQLDFNSPYCKAMTEFAKKESLTNLYNLYNKGIYINYCFELKIPSESEKNIYFPRIVLVEKKYQQDEELNIIWNTIPSENFYNKPHKNFLEFHAHFLDKIKPDMKIDGETLYKEFDKYRKRDEPFFFNSGKRNVSDGQYYTYYITNKHIISFVFPFPIINDEPRFTCHWYSNIDNSCIAKNVTEHEIYDFPDGDLVENNESNESKLHENDFNNFNG